jgi:hypothetical protein
MTGAKSVTRMTLVPVNLVITETNRLHGLSLNFIGYIINSI